MLGEGGRRKGRACDKDARTLIFEKYNVKEAAAVKLVVAAQDAEFFVRHDDDKKLRTIDQAHKDAKTIYEASLGMR